MANENTAEATHKRCKHDHDMVDQVSERLFKIKAVGDLLMCTQSGHLAKDTLNNIGWLLLDLANEAKAIVCETEDVTA